MWCSAQKKVCMTIFEWIWLHHCNFLFWRFPYDLWACCLVRHLDSNNPCAGKHPVGIMSLYIYYEYCGAQNDYCFGLVMAWCNSSLTNLSQCLTSQLSLLSNSQYHDYLPCKYQKRSVRHIHGGEGETQTTSIPMRSMMIALCWLKAEQEYIPNQQGEGNTHSQANTSAHHRHCTWLRARCADIGCYQWNL